ncbi:MAG: protoheme IX farnesyltransferase [Bdellovibrionota bacterium]|nr:MAG: protoheme IX farnesyltransferase [Bdellovibrionota bacterium]
MRAAGDYSIGSSCEFADRILALLTAFLYALVYTPLKRITWLNTPVGAIPGALPILGGWSASAGGLDAGAWILFGILFLWQHPHFYSIAWMYREDYARGGFKMLPVIDPDGVRTFRQIIGFTLALILVSLLPVVYQNAGIQYTVAALILGAYFMHAGVRLFRSHSVQDAKKLLRVSVVYLPLLLVMIVIDRGIV